MRYLIFLLFLSTTCLANNNPYGAGTGDKFEWTDYDDTVHLLASYSFGLTTALVLERTTSLPKWQCALFGAILPGLIGTAKEAFFDDHASQTDLKTWWAGGAAAGLTFTVIRF